MKKKNDANRGIVAQNSSSQITIVRFVMDIQIINANSRSIIMFPTKLQPTYDWSSVYKWHKTFKSDGVIVYAQCASNPGWTDDVYIGMFRAWKRGEWRKLDLRRTEDRS